MDIIGSQKIWTFTPGKREVVALTCSAIRKGDAVLVRNYMDLATKVAELQFNNRDFVLMFRGQPEDYKNIRGYTSMKPTLLRSKDSRQNPTDTVIGSRFSILDDCERNLVSLYDEVNLKGFDRIERHRILRWAILQHYEICRTPLLDVTQSLRIAASFASLKAQEEAFVFVLGIPHVSGAITASAEAGLQIIRLASVCPPSAVRPHIQEGYLLGEYPECASTEQNVLYSHAEMDFGRRLIAKFRFNPETFWEKSGQFPRVEKDALYPISKYDPFLVISEKIKDAALI